MKLWKWKVEGREAFSGMASEEAFGPWAHIVEGGLWLGNNGGFGEQGLRLGSMESMQTILSYITLSEISSLATLNSPPSRANSKLAKMTKLKPFCLAMSFELDREKRLKSWLDPKQCIWKLRGHLVCWKIRSWRLGRCCESSRRNRLRKRGRSMFCM